MTSQIPDLNQNLPMRSISQEVSSKAGVFAVCFCFLFSIAPHFVNLPVWVIVIVLIALGWRSLQNLGLIRELPKWMLIPLIVLLILAPYYKITSFRNTEWQTHYSLYKNAVYDLYRLNLKNFRDQAN